MSTIIPISDPGRGFRLWAIDEIYTGTGTGRYVPNLHDAVWSWTQGLYRVIDVDYTTGLSILQKHVPPKENPDIDETDILLGGGAGPVSESFRVYIDTSVMPHTLAVDSSLRIHSTTANSVKLFKGFDVSNNGVVISRNYDQNGQLLGENIPLELVAYPEGENFAIKTPKVAHTIYQLDDGEVVTAVVYDDLGNAISVSKLIVKNTSFIRTTDASKRYIASVRLESPFLSDADPRVLEYPVNLPIQAMSMMGVVTYSDGGTRRLPIDGTKFTLHGLNNYIATIVGQRIPLVLTYRLSEDEASYDAQSGYQYHISEEYHAKTIEVSGAYGVKIYSYPVWQDPLNGYRLEHFMYNLERGQVYNVTPHVTLATSSPSFNPTLYGVTQNLTLTLNLDEVNGIFAAYRHVQTVGISLLAPGNVDDANWTVQFNAGQDPVFGGAGIQGRMDFINAEHWTLHIDLGAGSKEHWLHLLYDKILPLYNTYTEVEPPEPNFFRLVLADRVIEYPISQWEAELDIQSQLVEGQTVFIEFFKRLSTTDLELGVAAIPIHQNTVVP